MARVLIHVMPGECLCVGPSLNGGAYSWVCDKDKSGMIWVELPDGGNEEIVIGTPFFMGEEDDEGGNEDERPRIVPPFLLPRVKAATGGMPLIIFDPSKQTALNVGQTLVIENGVLPGSTAMMIKDISDVTADASIDVDELPNFHGTMFIDRSIEFDDTSEALNSRILEFFNQVSDPIEIVDRIRDNPTTGVPSPRAYGIKQSTAYQLLEKRSSLPGGIFTDIAEIDDTPGVGPDTLGDIYYTFQNVKISQTNRGELQEFFDDVEEATDWELTEFANLFIETIDVEDDSADEEELQLTRGEWDAMVGLLTFPIGVFSPLPPLQLDAKQRARNAAWKKWREKIQADFIRRLKKLNINAGLRKRIIADWLKIFFPRPNWKNLRKFSKKYGVLLWQTWKAWKAAKKAVGPPPDKKKPPTHPKSKADPKEVKKLIEAADKAEAKKKKK